MKPETNSVAETGRPTLPIHELPASNEWLRVVKGAPGMAYVIDLLTGTVVGKVFLVRGTTWSVSVRINGQERCSASYTGLRRVLSLIAQMRKGVA